MPTFNIDTAVAVSRLERVGMPTDQAREIVDIIAEADAEHITKAQFVAANEKLEQQMQTGFANIESTIHKTINASQMRVVGIGLGGLAIATAIILALD